jgi:hypothetical protein
MLLIRTFINNNSCIPILNGQNFLDWKDKIAAQLTSLEIYILDSFLVHLILNFFHKEYGTYIYIYIYIYICSIFFMEKVEY